jgi:hypothetical protein
MTTTTRKPTAAQAHVLRRMAEGWELANFGHIQWALRLRIRGQEQETVSYQTFIALQDRGWITSRRDTTVTGGIMRDLYHLTDAGRVVVAE